MKLFSPLTLSLSKGYPFLQISRCVHSEGQGFDKLSLDGFGLGGVQ